MTNYINTITSQYPVSEQDIRLANPNTSFTTPFTPPPEYQVVFPAPKPEYNSVIQTVQETAPELTIKSTWEQRWVIVNIFDTQEEEDAAITADTANKNAALLSSITNDIQLRLDTFAKTRNYDGILSACTYATSSVPKFQTEGQYCVDSRDSTWATSYTIFADVQAGARPMPSGYADIESELPVLAWPN